VRETQGLTEYIQLSFSAGFVTLIQEQMYFILCAAVAATRDGLTYDEWIKAAEKNPRIKETRKEERMGFRKWGYKMDWLVNIVQMVQMSWAIQAEFTGINRDAPWLLYGR